MKYFIISILIRNKIQNSHVRKINQPNRYNMKNFYTIIGLFLFVFILPYHSTAQEDDQQSDLYEMDLESLMQIEIVSASKKAEDIFDAPLGATVLKADQIKESGATSIMEALRLIPGLIVRETTPGNYDIHLRGYDAIDPKGLITMTANTMTLIMVNNRTVYNEFQGQTYWELLHINIDDVERIEVVRGPVSAMYGPNAVSGVINILTKNPKEEKGFEASTYTMGGHPKALISSTSASYNFGNGLSMRVSGNADFRDRHHSDYFIFSENDFVDELDETTITNTLGLPVLDPIRPYLGISLSGQLIPNYNIHDRHPYENLATERFGTNAHVRYNKNDLDLNFMGGYSQAKVQRVYGNNNIAALTTDSLNNTFMHFWGTYKDLTVSVDYNLGDNSIIGSGPLLSVENDILSAMAEYNLQVTDNFSLKPGAAYKTSSYTSMGLGSSAQRIDPADFFTDGYEEYTPDDGGPVSNSVISGHLQADYTLGDLRLIGAARIDKFENPDKAKISPLFSATYKITEDFLVRGSYGRSSRTPFNFDLFMDISLRYPSGTTDQGVELYNNIWYRGTERSDEITGDQKYEYNLLTVDDAEVGFRHKISDSFTLDIELFWSKLSNLLALNMVKRDTLDGTHPFTGGDTREAIEYYSFVNLDMSPQQTGAMISLRSMPFRNINFDIYVMVQQTKINNYADSIDIEGNAVDSELDADTDATSDYYHQATPSFTGGLNTNYRPIKKLNINLNAYFYSHQFVVINNEMNQGTVDANILLNATVSYEFFPDMKIFVTGRNLVGGDKRQFAFADKIGPSVFGGLNIKF